MTASIAAPRVGLGDRTLELRAIVSVVDARLSRLALACASEASASDLADADVAVEMAEMELAEAEGGRLARLLALFSCSASDRALLLTAVAPQIDPAISARYAALQGGRPEATEALAAMLFGFGLEPIAAGSRNAMVWRLVREAAPQPGLTRVLEADPVLREWLSGELSIDPRLRGAVAVAEPRPALAGWPVEFAAAHAKAAVARSERALFVVEGLRGSGRATFVADVAEALGQRCFTVEPEAFGGAWDAEATLLVHRFALAAGAVLVWRHAVPAQLWPRGAWPAPVQAVTIEPGEEIDAGHRFALQRVGLPVMTRDERAQLLDRLVPASAGWSVETRRVLSDRRALVPAEIRRLGRVDPPRDAHALELANEGHAHVMGDLARRVEGTFGWDDLILPESLKTHLADLTFECRTRSQLWSDADVRRHFGHEHALIAMFQGPSGTGKTMSARLIANDLGLDRFRIDCATVTSKYIGETASNLRRIFLNARRIDAVLFFDEADALFAKRTDVRDAHDRYANADTSYLLQLIEGEFDGIAILATNRPSDLDHAFLRRIRYVLAYGRPSGRERTELWRRSAELLLPPVSRSQLEGLWPVVGEALDVTGAQIKTILLSAYFAARRLVRDLTAEDLVRAAERELMKEGRSMGARERQRITGHG